MKYIVGLVVMRVVFEIIRSVIRKIKNYKRIKNNERVMSKGGSWYGKSTLTKQIERGEVIVDGKSKNYS